MTDTLAAIRASAARLNSRSDDANRYIASVEADLRDAGVGIEVDTPGLGWRRVNGAWRIVCCTEDGVIRPLTDAKREKRIEAVVLVPLLLVAIATALDEANARIEVSQPQVRSQK